MKKISDSTWFSLHADSKSDNSHEVKFLNPLSKIDHPFSI